MRSGVSFSPCMGSAGTQLRNNYAQDLLLNREITVYFANIHIDELLDLLGGDSV